MFQLVVSTSSAFFILVSVNKSHEARIALEYFRVRFIAIDEIIHPEGLDYLGSNSGNRGGIPATLLSTGPSLLEGNMQMVVFGSVDHASVDVQDVHRLFLLLLVDKVGDEMFLS